MAPRFFCQAETVVDFNARRTLQLDAPGNAVFCPGGIALEPANPRAGDDSRSFFHPLPDGLAFDGMAPGMHISITSHIVWCDLALTSGKAV